MCSPWQTLSCIGLVAKGLHVTLIDVSSILFQDGAFLIETSGDIVGTREHDGKG